MLIVSSNMSSNLTRDIQAKVIQCSLLYIVQSLSLLRQDIQTSLMVAIILLFIVIFFNLLNYYGYFLVS